MRLSSDGKQSETTSYNSTTMINDKYELIKQIGRGAHGTVHVARQLNLDSSTTFGRLVVIKKVSIDGLSATERAQAYSEAEMLRMLQHPNIIGYLDTYVNANELCIAMQYAQGGTLYHYIKERKGRLLDEPTIIDYFTQIAMSLHYLLKQNILHRDLKTQNILMNRKRTVCMLSDFGISKLMVSQTRAVTVIGTPGYLAPEVFQGRAYNHKCDVWSIGCCLYELTTLRPAFIGDNFAAISKKISDNNYKPLEQHISASLRTLVENCLQTNENQRWDIRQVLAHPTVLRRSIDLSTDMGMLNIAHYNNRVTQQPGDGFAHPSQPKRLLTRIDSHPVSASYRRSQRMNRPRHTQLYYGKLSRLLSTSSADESQASRSSQTSIRTRALKMPLAEKKFHSIATDGFSHFAVSDTGRAYRWLEGDIDEIGDGPLMQSDVLNITEDHMNNVSSTPTKQRRQPFDQLDLSMVPSEPFSTRSVQSRSSMNVTPPSHSVNSHRSSDLEQTPQPVSSLQTQQIQTIAMGHMFQAALTSQGMLLTWGSGQSGSLGHGNLDDVNEPLNVETFITTDLKMIAVGWQHIVALTVENRLFAWGKRDQGRLGVSDVISSRSKQAAHILTPTEIFLPDKVDRQHIHSIHACADASAVLMNDGSVYACGNNRTGKLSMRDGATVVPVLTRCDRLPTVDTTLKRPYAMGTNCTALVAGGQVYVVSAENQGRAMPLDLCDPSDSDVGNGNVQQRLPVMLACGTESTAIVTSDERVYVHQLSGTASSTSTSNLNSAVNQSPQRRSSTQSTSGLMNTVSRVQLPCQSSGTTIVTKVVDVALSENTILLAVNI